MAEVKAFKALRFREDKAGEISQLTCPPYDIISEEQRLGYLEKNSHNIIRFELPKGERPYEEAAETLSKWEEEGILSTDDKPSLYIYEEEFEALGKTLKLKGFICRVKLEEFEKGVVLPHEFTLSKAKADRFSLMSTTFCNFSQIYSLYMDEEGSTRPKIDVASCDAPEVEFTDESGITHRLWTVTDEETVNSICADFTERRLYIADGHHRYETALNFRNEMRAKGLDCEGTEYVMMMLVDMAHEGLVVLPTHRVVRDLENFDVDKIIPDIEKYFDITDVRGTDSINPMLDGLYEENKKAFAMYTGGDSWKLLVLKDISVMDGKLPEMSKASRNLDVAVLHTLILEECFGIDKENMAQQINLTYVKNAEDALSDVDNGKAQCAFILNPTRVTEIRDVAAADERMPQKSTYFYPKLITGLVMNKLRDMKG